MREWLAILAVVTACGAGDSTSSTPKPQVGPTATPAAPADAIAAIPDAAPVVTSSKPARRVPPIGCSDGGAITGAVLGDNAGRYCIDSDCWKFDLHALAPIRDNPTNVLTPATGETFLDPDSRHKPPPPDPWTATPVEAAKHDLQICEVKTQACWTLHVDTLQGDSDGVRGGAVSDTGERVAVTRGVEWGDHGEVEVYERATGKLIYRQKSRQCLVTQGFAGNAAVLHDWPCVNQIGDHYVISPDGKTATKLPGDDHSTGDQIVKLDDHVYAFPTLDGDVEIVDEATAKVRSRVKLDQFSRFGAAHGRLYGFSAGGSVSIFDADGATLAHFTPETCRWTWESLSIGGVNLTMRGPDVIKAAKMPRGQKRLGDGMTSWAYDDGLTLTMQSFGDSYSKPVMYVHAIDVVAPSTLKLDLGVGVGTPVADLDRIMGPYEVDRTSTTRLYGNAKDKPGGWLFTLDKGVVSAIHVSQN